MTVSSESKMKEKLPGPGSAFALFILASFLNVVLSLILFSISEELGVVAAEPLAILIPTLLMVRFLGLDFGKSLRLKLPSGTDLLLALPLALSLTVLNDQILNLTNLVFPFPKEIQEGLTRLLRAESAFDWMIRLLGIGVGAALSEEILFRGFIQKGLERGFNRYAGLVLTSILFALIHLIPQGIPSYFFAGLVLGTTALATESIVVPIVLHFVYNMSAVTLLSAYGIETLGRPVWIPPIFLIPALLIFGLTFGYFVRKAATAPRPQPTMPAPTSVPTPTAIAGSVSSPYPVVVDPRRRRLGWLAVGCAAAGGTLVILSLFGYTVYNAHSRTIRASMIETMRQDVLGSLSTSASSEVGRVHEAFDALAEVNRKGHLRLKQLSSLIWILAKARSDGWVSPDELEPILEEIRSLVHAASPVRRL